VVTGSLQTVKVICMLKSLEGKDEHFCCLIEKKTDSMGLLFFKNTPPPIIDKLCVQIIPPNSENLYINMSLRGVCVYVVLVHANL